jgi:hypothetical protein
MNMFRYQGRLYAPEGDGSSGGGGGNATVLGGGNSNSGAGGNSNAGAAVNIPDNWRDALPDDLKADPSLKDYKPGKDGFVNLAKTLVNAQKLVGREKIARPAKDAPKEVWEAFYEAGGRPKTAGDYQLNLPENLKGVQLDQKKIEKWQAKFHELGVSQSQYESILTEFLGSTHAEITAKSQAEQQAREQGITALRTEWGDKTDTKFNVAASVVAKFGGEEAQKYFTESGLGNDPKLIKLFASIGEAMLEDRADGNGLGALVTDKARAEAEIKNLKLDKNFMSALTTRGAQGHKEALEKWTHLHKLLSDQKP